MEKEREEWREGEVRRRKEKDRYPKIAKLHARVSQSVSQSDSFKAVDVVAKNCHSSMPHRPTPRLRQRRRRWFFGVQARSVARKEGRKDGREGGREEERVEGERQLNNRRNCENVNFPLVKSKRASGRIMHGTE